MKSLKKKICISVFLDELFEEVEEKQKKTGSEYGKELVPADECSSLILTDEQLSSQQSRRSRKYRNAWRLINKRRNSLFRNESKSTESAEDIPENRSEESREMKEEDEDSKNDYDVDEYPESDLDLEFEKEECGGSGGNIDLSGELRLEEVREKVDAAVSTCFAGGDETKKRPSTETNPSRENIDASEGSTTRPETVKRNGSAGKRSVTFDTTEAEESKNVGTPIASSKETVRENVDAAMMTTKTVPSREKACLPLGGRSVCGATADIREYSLVARCAKSMDLTRKNNKSTQFDFKGLSSEPIDEDCTNLSENGNESYEVNLGEGKVEELFHYLHPKKSLKVVRRVAGVIARPPLSELDAGKDELMTADRSFEKAVNQQMELISLWHNEKLSKDWLSCIDGDDPESKVLKKGFCDVTVKTLMTANRDQCLCYSMSIPWEVTALGEFVIPQNGVRTALIQREGSASPDSLSLFANKSSNGVGIAMSTESTGKLSKIDSVDSGREKVSLGTEIDLGFDEFSGRTNEKMAWCGNEKVRQQQTSARRDQVENQDAGDDRESPATKEQDSSTSGGEQADKRSQASDKENGKFEKNDGKPATNNRDCQTNSSGENARRVEDRKLVDVGVGTEETTSVGGTEHEEKCKSSQIADKSVGTEPSRKDASSALASRESSDEDIIIKWEVQIEIQSDEGTDLSASKEDVVIESNNSRMIRAIEDGSKTNVILICNPAADGRMILEERSQSSELYSDTEQCYLKDEKIHRMYLANVPRYLLQMTEKKLKEIGRG